MTAMAPALMKGLRGSPLDFQLHDRIEGPARGLAADPVPQVVADLAERQRQGEDLGDALDRERCSAVPGGCDVALRIDDHQPKGLGSTLASSEYRSRPRPVGPAPHVVGDVTHDAVESDTGLLATCPTKAGCSTTTISKRLTLPCIRRLAMGTRRRNRSDGEVRGQCPRICGGLQGLFNTTPHFWHLPGSSRGVARPRARRSAAALAELDEIPPTISTTQRQVSSGGSRGRRCSGTRARPPRRGSRWRSIVADHAPFPA